MYQTFKKWYRCTEHRTRANRLVKTVPISRILINLAGSIKKEKDEVLREIKVSLKQKNLIMGNLCGHPSTPSQYLFFVGKDNHLHLMRYGVSLFSEIKRDDLPIMETPKTYISQKHVTVNCL